MKRMRWLLILLVVLLQVQAPAVAEAAPAAAASCHDMAQMDHGRQDQDRDQGAKLHQGKAHQCPGCSIPGTTPVVEPLADIAPFTPVATGLASLDPHAQPPRLPPPRQA